MRGEGDGGGLGGGEAGIIPAGAGRRRPCAPSRPSTRDHPRGCGEKAILVPRLFLMAGSSPRVRGEVAAIAKAEAHRGIIPAGAGRSPLCFARWRRCGDHPRGCGEKASARAAKSRSSGSSPRVRGEEHKQNHPYARPGIIPAGAGRRFTAVGVPVAEWDHPRGCGEKEGKVRGDGELAGSSPRVRGEAYSKSDVDGKLGIIPAGAGRSCFPKATLPFTRDHPRGCGEKLRKMAV